MKNIMTQIRELKDEIERLEADKRQLEAMLESDEQYFVKTKPIPYAVIVKYVDLQSDMRKRCGMLEIDIDDAVRRLKALERRTAYQYEREPYYLLDLNDIAGVIDKDGFIRGIKF